MRGDSDVESPDTTLLSRIGLGNKKAAGMDALMAVWAQIRAGVILLLAANLVFTIFRRMLVRFPR